MVSLNDFSSLFVDYYNYYKKYSDLYGDKVIILHQTGHFFEIYDYPVDDGFLCSDIQKVSKIVNINVTRRDKNKDISPKNWLMSGVPLMKLDKYCEIFLQNNYHVIVISQVSKPPNIEREVTHVLSPGTVLNDFNINVENNLVSIYIEKNILMNKELYSAGISIINVATGKSMITNVIQNYEDEKYTDNEIQRILSYYNPVEILVHTKDFYLTKEEIINKYDLSHDNIYINHFIEEKEFTQIPYQNNLLQKVFNFNTMNTPIEELNLERKEEVLLSYVYLLNFIHQHKTTLIDNVERPNELNDENYLTLSADSVRQLNVFNNYSFYTGRNQDLFSLLNKTVTQIGTRLYKNRLLYPCLDTNTINERYDIVELLFPNNYYEQIRMNLKRINDFEKSLRKMSLNELNTANFYSDYICYDFVKNTIELIKDNSRLSDKYTSYNEDFDLFNEYNDKINNTYEFSNFGSYNSSNDIEKSLFKKGIYSDIDLLDEKIKTSLYHYELIIKKFSKIIDPKNKSKLVKLEYTEKFCWYLSVTKNRSKVIKKYLDNKKIIVKDDDGNTICKFDKESITFRNKDNSNCFIESKFIDSLSNDIIKHNKELNHLNTIHWKHTIQDLYNEYKNSLKQINNFIGDIDCHANNAFISIKYNYYRPEIQESDKSFVKVEGIRHPIAEEINKNSEYIKNDFSLGVPEQSGLLLYGMNSGGKSTLSKAIALSIIMAQSGCYVPARSFIYSQYTQIFTRILSNDKLWSGLSSFQVEVLEMKHILNNADKNSLVIGDEVFNSSESVSAISLVNGCIHKLHELDSSFIFATHLHELIDLPDMKELFKQNLKVYHLQVRVENNVLLFDRILKEGSGPESYGILVAETLGLFNDVISIANKTKLHLKNESENIIRKKKSNYNSNIIMDKCKFPGCCNKPDDSHHIHEQQDADENGNFENFHKNNEHNLIPLCKKHHDEITYGKLIINGYIQTSEGLKLDYEYKSTKKVKKKKFDEQQIQLIKEYYNNNKLLSKKDIMNQLFINNDISISTQIFNKIITDTY